MYNALPFDSAKDKKKMSKVMELMERQCIAKQMSFTRDSCSTGEIRKSTILREISDDDDRVGT